VHELGIAQSILDIARDHLPREGRGAVEVVRIRVGRMAGVVVESLVFCFEALVPGTPLEGARLEVEEVPVRLRCRGCGEELITPTLVLSCPACGSPETTLLSGTELQVLEIELAEESQDA